MTARTSIEYRMWSYGVTGQFLVWLAVGLALLIAGVLMFARAAYEIATSSIPDYRLVPVGIAFECFGFAVFWIAMTDLRRTRTEFQNALGERLAESGSTAT